MPDAASIIATLAAIKNSMDIVKAVKDADYDLDKAILKEKIVVLVDSLLEAKIQANEALDLIKEKDERIKELEDAFKLKSKLQFKDFAYYQIDEDNNTFGEPYCSYCWEQKQKIVKLTKPHLRSNFIVCPNCKNTFSKV